MLRNEAVDLAFIEIGLISGCCVYIPTVDADGTAARVARGKMMNDLKHPAIAQFQSSSRQNIFLVDQFDNKKFYMVVNGSKVDVAFPFSPAQALAVMLARLQ